MDKDYEALPEDSRGDDERGGSKSRRDRSRSRDRWGMQQAATADSSLLSSATSAHGRTGPVGLAWAHTVILEHLYVTCAGVIRRITSGAAGQGTGTGAGEQAKAVAGQQLAGTQHCRPAAQTASSTLF